jgi:Tfp pilus assembly protein PilO
MNFKLKQFYNNYLAYFLAIAVLIIAMGGLIIWPAFAKIIAIKTEISQEKANLEKKLSMGLNAKKTKEDLQKIDESLTVLDMIFINAAGELTLLSTIENLAANHNVAVTIKPDFVGQNLGNVTRLPVAIEAKGKFNDLISFLNDLDQTPFYFIDDQIILTKGAGSDLILNLTGQVYMKTADKNK